MEGQAHGRILIHHSAVQRRILQRRPNIGTGKPLPFKLELRRRRKWQRRDEDSSHALSAQNAAGPLEGHALFGEAKMLEAIAQHLGTGQSAVERIHVVKEILPMSGSGYAVKKQIAGLSFRGRLPRSCAMSVETMGFGLYPISRAIFWIRRRVDSGRFG